MKANPSLQLMKLKESKSMEEKMKFENKLNRLDEIVDTMTKKTLPLEEALSLYEEGNKIIKELDEALKEAEDKIEKVIESK